MENITQKENPTEKLNFDKAEMDCLHAATRAIENVAQKLQAYNRATDSTGVPKQFGTYAHNLLTLVVHDKYSSCVQASAVPHGASGKEEEKTRW